MEHIRSCLLKHDFSYMHMHVTKFIIIFVVRFGKGIVCAVKIKEGVEKSQDSC